ncbi:MAG: DUF6232 family protein [Anaerolineae bacterium]|nr:DUF6232 family protein [Anaerolineae bacterium]
MFFSEPILFRTRNVILTDQRIFIDGTMVSLEQIDHVRPTRPNYFLPLMVGRLLTLVGIVYMLVQFRAQMADGAGITMLALPLVVAVVLGALLYWSMREIPTHIVQIETGTERINVMHVYDAKRAQLVVRKISDAVNDPRHKAGSL